MKEHNYQSLQGTIGNLILRLAGWAEEFPVEHEDHGYLKDCVHDLRMLADDLRDIHRDQRRGRQLTIKLEDANGRE